MKRSLCINIEQKYLFTMSKFSYINILQDNKICPANAILFEGNDILANYLNKTIHI